MKKLLQVHEFGGFILADRGNRNTGFLGYNYGHVLGGDGRFFLLGYVSSHFINKIDGFFWQYPIVNIAHGELDG